MFGTLLALLSRLSISLLLQVFQLNPVYLPFEGPLLVTSTAAGDGLLFYDVGSGRTRELTLGPGVYHPWDFSPDGCRVLYTLQQGDTTELYSVRLDGTDARALLDTSALPEGDWSAWEPDWSPDGTRIALTLSRTTNDGRESRIAWVLSSGGEPTFYSVSGDEHTPRWSPDGTRLAYVSYELRAAGADIYATAAPTPVDAPPGPLLREADIWLVSLDGALKDQLTFFDVGSAAVPRWSPDGSLVGFVYSPQPGDNQFWMIASVPEAIPTQLSSRWNQTLDLTWLPDGSAMVAAARDFRGEGDARLWQIPLVGNADADAAPYTQSLLNTPADYPRFSADGAWLAFRSGYDIVLTETSTEASQVLGMFGSVPPVWSPAGFEGEAACG